MDGAALLPDCTGTKEEYFYKESKEMKAKKILSLLLALVMVLALGTSAFAATGDMSNPVTVSGVTLTFGDTEAPTAPECNMYFKETANNTYDAIYSTDGTTASTSFYPSILALYITGSVNSISATDIDFVTYDDEGNPTISSTIEVNPDGYYTIKPKTGNSQIVVNGTVTVNFSAPISSAAASGSIAKAICGYLPVGQFARYNSFGWGAIFTDGTNIYDSSKQAKFVSSTGEGTSYIATGVSLGMAGGYVQFDMGTDENGADRLITNNPNNKYGIDFIVYGNAFVGNPEAGIVKVSQDGTNWYTLAGSRHYMNGTQWNQNISYIRIAAANTTISGKSFAKAGIYCSTNFVVPASDNASDVNAAIGAATWTGVAQLTGNTYPKTLSTANPAPAAWWPEWTNDASGNAENYGQVWKINGDGDLGDVSWLRSGSAEVITYKNVTTVEDDMVVLNKTLSAAPTQAQMTDVYQWGYADVRPNAPSGADAVYGQAVNPYAVAASSTTEASGDGFDLSWAVDDNGMPVKLEGVRYIRVYSGVLFSAGVFGETSTEVCGLYVTANTTTDGVATPATLTFRNSTYSPVAVNGSQTQGITTIRQPAGSSRTYTVNASGRVFVNGVTMESNQLPITLGSGESKLVQIVTQTNDGAAYINVVRFVAD